MRQILLALALLALPAAAQEQPKPAEQQPQEKRIQKLIALKYADPLAVRDLLKVFPIGVEVNREMRVLALSGLESAVATAVQAIKDLDVPAAAQKNIELTVYYLSGTDSESEPGSAPPAELAGVISQLKATFPFKQYRLMDVFRLRTRAGQAAQTSGMGGSVNIGGTNRPISSQFRLRSASVSPDGSTVHIDGLQSSSRVPVAEGGGTQFSYQDLILNTDLDIKDGQKAVVGRMGIERDKALFLVLTAQVVQ